MAEVTGRVPWAIRRRILEEYRKVETKIATNPKLWRSVAFRAHKRIYENMGGDFVNYPEFEFWFSRFLQGNFNLYHDRRSDPKARSFTDLPLDVFENIGEYLKLEDRMRLRDVCKDVQFQVDNWDLKVDEISYSDRNGWRAFNRSSPGFHRDPISFVTSVLKLPNLQLEKLKIREPDDDWKELIRKLDRSNRKLHVKNVKFVSFSSKIDLHFMVPQVLEEITLFIENPKYEGMYEFIESEQCQSAKMVHIYTRTLTSKFPLEALYNCPRFTLTLGGKQADGLIAEFLKTLMKYGEVQKCVLHLVGPSDLRYLPRELLERFGEPKTLRRYPIPGSNDFYELEYRETFVRLERKH